jgi:hypothetical protein
MTKKLTDFYSNRVDEYSKDLKEEDFLLKTNLILQADEEQWYKEHEIQFPFMFVFGLPRSGTTLLSQFIAHSFDVSFINNFVARFWLAPLHGIRLSNVILGRNKNTSFSSDYARTEIISDIHEFGYFWRYWLYKDDIEGVTNINAAEKKINWPLLKLVLSNIQYEFHKPMIFKNIFGSYHMKKLISLLGKVIFVYIERDESDVAISILNARKKYYKKLTTWWSYMPPDYDKIKDLDYWEQIAGQIFYLKKFYNKTIKENNKNVITVTYKELCYSPETLAKKIQNRCAKLFDFDLRLLKDFPKNFPFRTYQNNNIEKEKFNKLINQFRYEN